MEGARKISPMQIRLPIALRTWLKESAGKNMRSMNSEIVARLEASKNQQMPEKEAVHVSNAAK